MNDSKTLLADKLGGYETTFRPVVNQSAPIVLYIGFELVSIQEFDEVQETLTITAVAYIIWIDEYMAWNPAGYGWLSELVIESEKVWTPNIVLTNSIKKLQKIGDSWHVIRFTSDGIAVYLPGDVFAASCKADITYYPWDRHRCGFNFNVWGHEETEIYFEALEDKVQTHYFSPNGGWIFYDSSIETLSEKSYISFYLYLERKPRFVLVNVILPIVFMTFLNAMGFLIPTECGERISYSLTMLLAITVFLTLVGDNLPKTSSPMSIFSYYLLTILIISIFITLATIYSLRLYYSNDLMPVSGYWSRIVRYCNCSCIKRRRTCTQYCTRNNGSSNGNSVYQATAQLDRQAEVTHSSSTATSFSYGMSVDCEYDKTQQSNTNSKAFYIYSPERERNAKMSGTNRESEIDTDITRKDVSVAFDVICFVMSIVTLSATTLVFIWNICTSDRD